MVSSERRDHDAALAEDQIIVFQILTILRRLVFQERLQTL